jgi:predicted DnaQ family exonuclease/DinG family helicase
MPSNSNPLHARFPFVVLDIETTGLDSAHDDIIEIGGIRFEEGVETGSFSRFLRPTKAVPTFIKQLTHITEADLATAGDPADVLAELRTFVGNDLLIFHNHSFDYPFINRAMARYSVPPLPFRVLDTLELSRIYFPFMPGHKLTMMAAKMGIPLNDAHRAIHDARATGLLFVALLDWIIEYIPLPLNHSLSEVAILSDSDTDLSGFLQEITGYQRKSVLLKPNPPKPFDVPTHDIEHDPITAKRPTMNEVFGPDGDLAKYFPGFEHREGQLRMAEGVAEALAEPHYLLCEAGTGVGKSLAYLVPAIEYSRATQKRVVVSTNTKNLQEQLFNKDLPTVRDCVDVPFKAVVLKGRENYLCPRKWEEVAFDLRNSLAPAEADAMLNLLVWKEYTRTGDISENSSFQRANFSTLWKKLAADRYFCPGRRCPQARNCYLLKIRQKAEEANLVIVNHSLLLADRMTDNTTIGPYDALIVDEAHNLPDSAARNFGVSIGFPDIAGFFAHLYVQRKNFTGGQLLRFKDAVERSLIGETAKSFLVGKVAEAVRLLDEGKAKFGEFFSHVGELASKPENYGKLRIKSLDEVPFLTPGIDELTTFLRSLQSVLAAMHATLTDQPADRFLKYDEHLGDLDGSIGRTFEFVETLTAFDDPDFTNNAVWFSSFIAGESDYPNGLLNCAPLEAGRHLRQRLYPGLDTVVFTSATLALRGKFKYFVARLGLDDESAPEGETSAPKVVEAVYPSPFDYPRQSLVIGTSFLPEPNDPFFQGQIGKLIREVIETTRVGTLALFTSYKDLNAVYEAVADPFFAQNINLLAQGKGLSRSVLLNEFRGFGSSVLFGTSSFWEGIDVQGDSLSLLIVTKLPFQVPSEPVVEAYLDKLKAEGKDSFMHYTLPNALLKFRQGFGRLIRSRSDSGVVLVLDNRVFTKYYGKYFQEILPTRIISTANPVELTGRVAKWFKDKEREAHR